MLVGKCPSVFNSYSLNKNEFLMTAKTTIELKPPYLIFMGDISSKLYAKTGQSIVDWRPELVAGQIAFEGNPLNLGVPGMTISEAVKAGVKSLIVGVAPVGGMIGGLWIDVLVEAALAGLDVVGGLHCRLGDFPELVTAAEKSGARLIDVRVPPENLPIGTGQKRTGQRILMVGTDCAVGKKYTALALTDCFKKAGLAATFRATGQTGIMIAGSGIPIDSVVADFVSGAAEQLTPNNDAEHWDVIEGQGSLFNASYAGVSLSLLHGAQPDALVVCHDPSRVFISSCPDVRVPTVVECIELNIRCAQLTNPAVQCVGVSLNTSALQHEERALYVSSLSSELGLPCIDPIIDGCGPILKRLTDVNLVKGARHA